MKFTTGEIISAGLGRLCCEMDAVYKIMNFLTGDNLFTHQLPRAFHACEKWVRQQHPWLNELDQTKCDTKTWRQWLADVEAKFGKEHDLEPLPADQWHYCDPVSELVQLREGKDNIIIVKP